jgi:hypothetical protein
MRKFVTKLGVLLFVFVAAVCIFSWIGNDSGTDMTEEMADASLPVLHFYCEDRQVNETHAYVDEMNASSIRDAITPLDESLRLQIALETYGNPVDELTYQIRSLDASRLIQDTKVESYTEEDGSVTATLQMQNLLEADTEYLLIVTMQSDGNTYYFYTRLKKETGQTVDEIIDFAEYFHETTFSGDGSELVSYIEPESVQANDSLDYINIHSSLAQVMWGSLKPQIVSDVDIQIDEMFLSFSCVTLRYLMSAQDEDGVTQYYDVTEYYRVRNAQNRMYLLDYNRSVEQIFTADAGNFSAEGISLGIRSQKVDYVSNEAGDCVAFVQNGELWSYRNQDSSVTRVFGFRESTTDMDSRNIYSQHDIHVMNVDETGSMQFVVYGYMNRGRHEGQVGMCIYHYDSSTNTIEEELFIQSDKSYGQMKEDMGVLMYAAGGKSFYTIVGDSVYRISMTDMTKEVLLDDIDSKSYVLSTDGRRIAWTEGESTEETDEITWMDLDTEMTYHISSENGKYIRPIGFIGTDFVYGIASEDDILNDLAGNKVFAMKELKIVDGENNEIKSYQADGYYVVNAYYEDDVLHLERVRENNGIYITAEEDSIVNNQDAANKKVSFTTDYHTLCQTVITIELSEELSSGMPKYKTPMSVLFEENRTVSMTEEEESIGGWYYVYYQGMVSGADKELARAIGQASTLGGVVVDTDQKLLYSRAVATAKSAISIDVPTTQAGGLVDGLDAILSYVGINKSSQPKMSEDNDLVSVLNELMAETATVRDLSGCTVEQLQYYLSEGSPVLIVTGENQAQIMVGYDEYNVFLLDTTTKKVSKKGKNDCQEWLEEIGNICISYTLND